MPLRETDPDFKSELFEIAKEAVNNKSEAFIYYLPLPLLVPENADEQIPCQEPVEETTAISAHI